MSIDAGASDHAAAVAINVLSYLHGIASTGPDRPLAGALRSALAAAAETAAVPEMYRKFMDAGLATGRETKRISVATADYRAPVAPADVTGNGSAVVLRSTELAASELDQVTGAAHRWRDALAERDRAILGAFDAGILGQTIAEAAGMSVAGVYRLRQRTAGEFHRG